MVCDLADTYHIFCYKDYDPMYVATLVDGLGHNSRVKRKINGYELPLETLLLAVCSDSLNWLVWSHSKDAEKGQNKPASIYEALTTIPTQKEKEVKSFNTPEEFEKEKLRIIQGKEGIDNG